MARVYATPEELKTHLGLTEEPEDAEELLAEASEEIDDILLASVYPVDQNGLPTKPEHADAIKHACLIQAKHRYTHGDETTISTSGGSMTLGPLHLGGVPGGIRNDDHQGIPQVPQRVLRILRNAGLMQTETYR